MVNRKAIRCGARACRCFSGHWRANSFLPRECFYKSGAPVLAGAPFLFCSSEVRPCRPRRLKLLLSSRAGVPVEMHLYAHGGHAFGFRGTEQQITRWPGLVETWLKTIRMISE